MSDPVDPWAQFSDPAYLEQLQQEDFARSNGKRQRNGSYKQPDAYGVEPSDRAPVVPLDQRRRAYCNGSYLTTVQIIEANDRDVLGGRKLEYDEMAGTVTLDRVAIADADETRVRAEIERRFTGGVSKEGAERGLKLTLGDVQQAVAQVARTRSYHPIRSYLDGLAWDGVPRLDAVAEDILGAERTSINQTFLRRWFISAVARALEPGCKVDTALILVGAQGVGKSGFFRVLAGPWFADTAVDLSRKDALMVLRSAWIYEWAELEVLKRARESSAVKAFLSSAIDIYVPPYGHNRVRVPRGCVIVGSTNADEFLSDETGNRRFWPVRVGRVDLALLTEQRDQLWAEATTYYRAREPWWLSPADDAAAAAAAAAHDITDAWADAVLSWAAGRLSEFRTCDVLEGAIEKPRGQWNRADEMRVVAILKRGGWRLGRKPARLSRAWERT